MLPPPRFIQIVLPFKMALIHCSQAPEHREVQTTGNISRPAASVEWVFFLQELMHCQVTATCQWNWNTKGHNFILYTLHSKTTSLTPENNEAATLLKFLQVFHFCFFPCFSPSGPHPPKKKGPPRLSQTPTGNQLSTPQRCANRASARTGLQLPDLRVFLSHKNRIFLQLERWR